MKDCDKIEELLAAYADDGLSGEENNTVARHVSSCARCSAEVAELRVLLRQTRETEEQPAVDEAIWQDISRHVRTALADADAKREQRLGVRLLGWMRRPSIVGAFCAAAAVVLGFVYVHNRNVARPTLEPDPVVFVPATPHPSATLPVVDENDLSTAQLKAVLHSLDELDDEPGPASTAAAMTVEEEVLAIATSHSGATDDFLENLDDEQLARLDAAL